MPLLRVPTRCDSTHRNHECPTATLYFRPSYVEISKSEDLQSEECVELVVDFPAGGFALILDKRAVNDLLVRLGQVCQWRDAGGWPDEERR